MFTRYIARSTSMVTNGAVRKYGESTSHHITEGIGKGKVIPLKFDYLRPAFNPPGFFNKFVTVGLWFHFTALTSYIVFALVPWTTSGGFQGKLPPNPKDIHK